MPLLSTIATHAATFLAGTLTGAAAAYLADRFTDQRRRSEAREQIAATFKTVTELMPDLITEMRTDLQGNPTTRDFFVLSSDRIVMGGSSTPAFAYYESQHKDLMGKVSILENHGYVIDITPGNAQKYRMTEEFAMLLTGKQR